MKYMTKKITKLLLIFVFMFTMLINLRINLNASELTTEKIGYAKIKLYTIKDSTEYHIQIKNITTKDIQDVYVYPQDDNQILVSLPIGKYQVENVESKEEEKIEIPTNKTFQIQSNQIVSVKIIENYYTGDVNDEIITNQDSKEVETGISLLSNPEDGTLQPVVDDSEQTQQSQSTKIVHHKDYTTIKIIIGITTLLICCIICVLIVKQYKKEN